MGDHRRGRPDREAAAPSPITNKHRATATRAGKRRADPARASLASGNLRRLAARPAVLGVVAISASFMGVLSETSVDATLSSAVSSDAATSKGFAASSEAFTRRSPLVSRSSYRRGRRLERSLVAAAEEQSIEREAALTKFDVQAAAQAARIEQNQWTLPVAYVALTARFGDSGLWANLHTGLDFNGDTGDPIYSVANGTVTAAGYDGSYGNKTVVTLEDGTEIWYCHQNTLLVGLGEQVRGGEQIGTIGATGNVTGSHLHLEVRPGGGDPVDPFIVFAAKGLL